MKKLVCILTLMVMSSAASAEGALDAQRIYLGGGLGFNSLPGYGSARGFQFFGGYDFAFKLNDDISSALEIGYMDTGDFDQYKGPGSNEDVKGLWAAMLESVPLSSKTDMLVRLGYDFGDDDGVLLGTGMQYKFTTKVAMRMEYIARQNVNALQANVLFHF
ncbi:MAG: outer membrane beta-barrel protein [Gammaproteobacteria bacterium]|nr:outer membrane beta-barrel protein [Gammaproteobacteria bacterium]